jgi:protein phosphatase
MSDLQLHYAALTHPGLVSRRNEDALLVAGHIIQKAVIRCGSLALDKTHRFAVSDGVGGLPNAAAASRLLLGKLRELDKIHSGLSAEETAYRLQRRLAVCCKQNPALEDGGATLVTAEISREEVSLWHVGDSRAYLFHAGNGVQLTQDHTLLNRLLAEGDVTPEEARRLEGRVFYQAVDELFMFSPYAETPRISTLSIKLAAGDVLLLASDGLSLHLTEADMAVCIDPLELKASALGLFAAVKSRGAEDNVSVILLGLRCAE